MGIHFKHKLTKQPLTLKERKEKYKIWPDITGRIEKVLECFLSTANVIPSSKKGCIEIGSNEASHDKVTHSIETFLRIYFMPLWGFIPEFILLRIYFMSPSLKEGFIFN